MTVEYGDIKCFKAPFGDVASTPVFEVISGVPRLSTTYILSPVEDRLRSMSMADYGIKDYMFDDEDYTAIAEQVYCGNGTLDVVIDHYLRELKNDLDAPALGQRPRPITAEAVQKVQHILANNGVEPDETGNVLQTIGYVLLDKELENLIDWDFGTQQEYEK